MSTRAKPWPWPLAPASSADFEALYREQMPRIYNFFRYRFGDNALAEDLTSVTFEKAWLKRSQYRHDLSAFSTWLFTIARRVAIDHYRQRQVEVALDEVHHLCADENLDETVQRQADLEQLNALLFQLDDRERELVALKYGAGLTNRAIANLSGYSESNVGVILHRIVKSLREKWDRSNE